MNGRTMQAIHRLLDGAYHIGITEDIDTCVTGAGVPAIRWIDTRGYSGGWFADPFIISADAETLVIYAEEYRYDTCRGRISRLTVSRPDLRLTKVETVLRLDSHLSFPYPVSEGGRDMFVPESKDDGRTSLYDLADGTPVAEILQGGYLDTQLLEHEGSWYAFTTKDRGGVLDDTRCLQVYSADSLRGPYRLLHEINNTSREERGAGLIFRHNGRLIRPAQICEGGYGKGVVFYALDIDGDKVTETEIGRVMADPRARNGLCLHTFSVCGGIAAVDGFDYPCRLIGRMAPAIYGLKAKTMRLIGKRP